MWGWVKRESGMGKKGCAMKPASNLSGDTGTPGSTSLAFAPVFVLVFLLLGSAAFGEENAVQAPRNPSSAKECALCHYRWVDTFFVDGRGSDLVPYQAEKVAASSEMCFSCHDGSVVDSRERVYNDRHHAVGKPPPEGMTIPDIFPLDADGNMQCATCHTAHGVSSEMGMEKTVFIRTSNDNSSMCRMCHTDKVGGPNAGNHPVDTTALKISSDLLQMGAVEGTEKNRVVCETCHTVHGAANNRFLVDSVRGGSHLCLDCHKDKAAIVDSGHDLRKSAPSSKNTHDQIPAESGVCGSCHLIHRADHLVLWGRKKVAEHKGKGTMAEDMCLSCHSNGGIAEKKQLSGYSHPFSMTLDDKGIQTDLPVYDKAGRRVPLGQGIVSCGTCHDPHLGPSSAGGGNRAAYFLRLPDSPEPILCRQCHPREALVEKSDHDLVFGKKKLRNIQGKLPEETGPCGACHLLHNSERTDLLALQVLSAGKKHPAARSCLTCHAETGIARNKQIGKQSHPLEIHPSAKNMETTLPLFNAKNGRPEESGVISCLTCHNPHVWNAATDHVEPSAGTEGDARTSFLRLPASPSPLLCANCHRQKGYVEKTDHDMITAAPESRNVKGQDPVQSGPCGACHSVHNAAYGVRLWARKFGRGSGVMDMMCKSCHRQGDIAAAKVPRVDSHPGGMLITNIGRNTPGRPNYFPLFGKRSGKKITVGDIACASCHDVHHWDPKQNRPGTGENVEGRATTSFLRMQTYSIMCIDCHGLDALFRFKYYHNSQKRGPDSR